MKRFLSIFLSLALLLACLTPITAFAVSKTIAWQQGTSRTIYTSSSKFSNSNNIVFEGVATSSESGSFKVTLQKKNIFGVWKDTSNVYTVKQHHNQTYSTTAKTMVTGQFFKLYWPGGSGTYRLKMSNPTVPQQTALSSLKFYTQ